MTTLVEHGHDIAGITANRPANAEVGQRFYDLTTGQYLVWNGEGWQGVGICALEGEFIEDGAGTYTVDFDLPAGSTLVDIIVTQQALWNAGTSASLEVGDAADPDGYFTAVDLKATDLLANESISFALAGGVAGAYIANSHVSKRYNAAARTITATVTSVGAGTTGRTRVTVLYSLPAVVAAVKS